MKVYLLFIRPKLLMLVIMALSSGQHYFAIADYNCSLSCSFYYISAKFTITVRVIIFTDVV